MSLNLINDIKNAYAQLNPGDVQRMANRVLNVAVIASSEHSFREIELALVPSPSVLLTRVASDGDSLAYDLTLCAPGELVGNGAFVFRAAAAAESIDRILDAKPDLEVPLARSFAAFREPVVNRIINRTSRENAMFSLVTALPNVLPSLIELPWAIGEFATDTAFLTINQVRMAFLIAAANGKPVGYNEQKLELATIVAGAFGWRAIARELIGKIPLGGGLIPKGAVAFAGTYVVGIGLERLHRNGTPMAKSAYKESYERALEQGRAVAGNLLSGLKKRNAG